MHIAIIDAAEDNREQLTATALECGYQASSVASVAAAQACAIERIADVVLLNVELLTCHSEASAVALLQQLKGAKPEVYLPIILIANDRDSAALLMYLQLGADDFHTKPFDSLILAAKLKAHLRTRELSMAVVEKNRSLAWHSQRMQQEHRIVQNIFSNALSRNLSEYPHAETYLLPHSTFNGDMYLLAHGPLGNLYLLLGDFTGHGLAAAIGTLPASQTFFAMAAQGTPIGHIAEEINRQLNKLLPENMFCCATIIEMSASGEHISWWSGGMSPALLVSPKQQLTEQLHAQHLPLGVLDTDSFSSAISIVHVEQGSRLLLYSDGAVEIGVQQGNPLGFEGFLQLCSDCDWQFSTLTERIKTLIEERGIDDDLSLVQLHCVATGLNTQSQPPALSPLPFSISVVLGPREIRTIDPVAHIVRGLGQMEGFKNFKASLYTVLSEAYNNAVDHGLLQLSSVMKSSNAGFDDYYLQRSERLARLQHGKIEFKLTYNPKDGLLQVSCCDSGPGFLTQPEANEHYTYGRGLQIIRELAQSVCWSEGGRCIHFALSLAPTERTPRLYWG